MSTKPPADPPMDRGVNPVRPATAPTPRKPAAPPPKSSGFQRFLLQFLLLVIALGGAFGTGYLVNDNQMQLDRSDLLQQQLDAQERILALEQQIAELRETRESGNRVELDLTEVFEPIREAVGRIALVRMGEISREISRRSSRGWWRPTSRRSTIPRTPPAPRRRAPCGAGSTTAAPRARRRSRRRRPRPASPSCRRAAAVPIRCSRTAPLPVRPNPPGRPWSSPAASRRMRILRRPR